MPSEHSAVGLQYLPGNVERQHGEFEVISLQLDGVSSGKRSRCSEMAVKVMKGTIKFGQC